MGSDRGDSMSHDRPTLSAKTGRDAPELAAIAAAYPWTQRRKASIYATRRRRLAGHPRAPRPKLPAPPVSGMGMIWAGRLIDESAACSLGVATGLDSARGRRAASLNGRGRCGLPVRSTNRPQRLPATS